MRKIEEKIIECIKSANNSDNEKTFILSERDTVKVSRDSARVFLWGNCIFKCTWENGVMAECSFNFCGWTTNTTKSRINACLSLLLGNRKCSLCKSSVIFDGSEVPSDKWVMLNSIDMRHHTVNYDEKQEYLN